MMRNIKIETHQDPLLNKLLVNTTFKLSSSGKMESYELEQWICRNRSISIIQKRWNIEIEKELKNNRKRRDTIFEHIAFKIIMHWSKVCITFVFCAKIDRGLKTKKGLAKYWPQKHIFCYLSFHNKGRFLIDMVGLPWSES